MTNSRRYCHGVLKPCYTDVIEQSPHSGNSFQRRSANNRPARVRSTPPHCLKKNGRSRTTHWSRISNTHSGCIGRAWGPDSSPTMTNEFPPAASAATAPATAHTRETERRPELHGATESGSHLLRLHTRADPDMWRKGQATRHTGQSFRMFGENLVRMPRCLRHHREDIGDKGIRYVGMEDITHRIDKNPAGFDPMQGLV